MQERAQSLRSRPLPAIVYYREVYGNGEIQRLRVGLHDPEVLPTFNLSRWWFVYVMRESIARPASLA
jgi:hypothetical protein